MKSFQRLIRMFTEADIELSTEELARLETRCNELVSQYHRRFALLILIIVPLCVFAALFGSRALGPLIAEYTNWSMRWSKLTGGLGLLAIATAVWLVLMTLLYRMPLRRALGELGHEVCLHCGYWLRDLPSDSSRCPECGAERVGIVRGNSHEDASS